MTTIKTGCATLFICALSLTTANGLHCFQCNSATEPECVALKSTDTSSPYYKECNRTSLGRTPIFCRKTVLLFTDDKDKTYRITRSCGWEIWKENVTNCLEVDSDFKFERSCQCFTDGCNSAPHFISMNKYYNVLLTCLAIFLPYWSSFIN